MFVTRRRHRRDLRSGPRASTHYVQTPRNIAFLREKNQLLRYQNTSVEINGYTYLLTDLLGQGGQGAVYLANVVGTDEQYAVKILIWEQSLLTTERLKHQGAVGFLNEVKKMMELQEKSEHVVKLIDAHAETTEVIVLGYLVMELGTGDLAKTIQDMAIKKARSNANASRAGASFTHAKDRKRVWRQLVKCVQVLHGENIVNTDLKPGNFIAFGEKIKLSDLGLAMHTDGKERYRSLGQGTPAYSALEVRAPYNFTPRAQRASSKADIYSLGIILYEMTYGVWPQIPSTDPVPPGSYEIGNQHNANPPKGKRMTNDPKLQDILYRTLQFNPDNRPNIHELRKHPYTRRPRVGFR